MTVRIVFGALSLLIVVALVGILAKKQLSAISPAPASSSGASGQAMAVPSGTPKQQVQQFEQAVQGAMQQARPMPEEK